MQKMQKPKMASMRRLIVAATILLSAPLGAYAQSAGSIQKYLAAQNQECSIYGYEEFFRGAIPGFSQPVTIAAYTVEGCGGGNNWGRTVSVFYSTGGSVREFKQPSPGVRGPDVGDKRGV